MLFLSAVNALGDRPQKGIAQGDRPQRTTGTDPRIRERGQTSESWRQTSEFGDRLL
ncbi:MAG: hypothetical protein LBQ77_06750 [Treponema sp.]|nr:hypothetical protein [Treponema sp.]